MGPVNQELVNSSSLFVVRDVLVYCSLRAWPMIPIGVFREDRAMKARLFTIVVLLLAGCASNAHAEDAPKGAPAGQPDVSDLSLEVTALQMLHQFQFTLGQMQKIRQCAQETVDKGQSRKKVQASQELRDKLLELRKALVLGNDDELIEQLSDELDELRLDENPAIEEEIQLTKEARRRAPELLRLLKASQYAAYTALLVDLPDPLDLLQESLPKIRELKGATWREERKQVADEIGRLVGGVDAAKEERLRAAVGKLLTRARRLSNQDFEDQQDQLEEEARQLIGSISPADVIRNEIEYSIAELLSNARLAEALAARLQL
jgi:hypothetical protein